MAWPKLNESIKSLRRANRMTQKELAEKSGCSLSAIRKYESGVLIPPLEKLYNIADALNQPIRQLDPDIFRSHSHFVAKLTALLKDHNISYDSLLTELGYNPEEFFSLKRLLNTPEFVSDSFILKVANYFAVPINSLYDSPEEAISSPSDKTFVLSDEEAAMIQLFRSMTEEGRKLFLEYLRILVSQPSLVLHQPAITVPDPGK